MLRDYPFTLNAQLIRSVIGQFEIDHLGEDVGIILLEFKFITPDSFIWKFLINNIVYYLYAEDFIESLKAVDTAIRDLTKDQAEFEFVKIKRPKNFESSGPVLASTQYKRPEDYENLKLYAADADYDFAFLVRSKESADEAYFSIPTS